MKERRACTKQRARFRPSELGQLLSNSMSTRCRFVGSSPKLAVGRPRPFNVAFVKASPPFASVPWEKVKLCPVVIGSLQNQQGKTKRNLNQMDVVEPKGAGQ